jgi:uncharacterized protein YgbK (DUF1537 family)
MQPANPALGRVIENGKYLIGNRYIENTTWAKDPDHPIFTSSVAELLRARDGNISQLPIITGKVFPENVQGLFIPDSAERPDLTEGLKQVCQYTLLAGSAAFFGDWIRNCWKLEEKPVQVSWVGLEAGAMWICGSLHENNKSWIEALGKKGITCLEIPVRWLSDPQRDSDFSRWSEQLTARWQERKQLVLYLPDSPLAGREAWPALLSRLGEVVNQCWQVCPAAELYVTGGQTAWGIIQAFQWKRLTPVQEMAPGVVRLQVNDQPGVHITVKPGSYDWPFVWNGKGNPVFTKENIAKS